ncbi:MAG: anti-sigma factor domain-containing protein [Pyrinomonadaceae bacterium]
MIDDRNDLLFDLLTKKAIFGLDEAEQRELDEVDPGTAEMEFRSLEMTAAAISLSGQSDDEVLPAHLRSRIIVDANAYVVDQNAKTVAWPPASHTAEAAHDTWSGNIRSSWFSRLGWAVAAAACIALAANIWFTRIQPQADVSENKPPAKTPNVLTPPEMRAELLRAATDAVKATWSVGNVKGLTQIVGDVVWSDEKQAGYMRVSGLPVNDATKEQYQLWIFDKNQDKATPIDGGVFNVNAEGEVVIPINAKIAAASPELFAITVERPGGVVVSKRGKIAALAKVETRPGSGA